MKFVTLYIAAVLFVGATARYHLRSHMPSPFNPSPFRRTSFRQASFRPSPFRPSHPVVRKTKNYKTKNYLSDLDVSGLTPEEYNALVEKCVGDWNKCANQGGSGPDAAACTQCVSSCGIPTPTFPNPGRDPELCTSLQTYCRVYSGAASPPPPPPVCYSPTCIVYYDLCKNPDPTNPDNDGACGYCGTACSHCPAIKDSCLGTSGSTAPGGCNNENCSYYAKLCEDAPYSEFCNRCVATCDGYPGCEGEKASCVATSR